jgi:EAL domain-containing protein (putative c-di-GMP-specific phosphodiesterase class I)/AmiR/NasT family two-component response regulator
MGSRPRSILVVEDSVVQRAHTVALCRNAGVEMVYEAGNGVEALELLKLLVLPPALMIVDLEMPGMDGIELIEELDRLNLDIPVIIASSREDVLIQSAETTGTALGLKVLCAVQKPLREADLATALLRAEEPLSSGTRRAPQAAAQWSREDLAQAIEQQHIYLCYQPKVDMQSGLVRGVEALARWTHPTAGNIPPDRFIAVAEREDLIYPLTLAVMAQAMAQAAAWNRRGLRLSMAINLSPVLLRSPSLVGDVVALQQQHALPAEQVVMEVTESALVADLGSALAALVRLRLKGFGLSIDDYGTGYSSMRQLAQIPFTELKIDRSFVHGAHQKNNLRVILKSALDMARQLGLCSVAEGIETMEDWRLLQELGCVVGQGYLIAKPLVADAIPQWLRQHQGRLSLLRGAPSAAAAAASRVNAA